MEYLAKHEVVILAETFIEETQMEQVQTKLPATHNWTWSAAWREASRGRAIGGLLLGTKKGIEKDVIDTSNKHLVAARIYINKK